MAQPDRDQLRTTVEQHLEVQEWVAAQAALERLWRLHASPALAGYVSAAFERLRPHSNFARCRVAILRSFTVDPILPVLRAAAWVNRLDLTVQAGDFNAYAQELLDPQSWVYSYAPDVAVLAVQTRDIVPELWDGFSDCSEASVRAAVVQVLDNFRHWISVFRSHSRACLLLHTLEIPLHINRGVLDGQAKAGQAEAIREINTGLVRLAAESPGVYVLDYDALVSAYGKSRWRDEHKWATVKMPMRAECMLPLANEWVRYLCPAAGRIAKVLVTDLDNTLWGGVVGEDGVSGIRIDGEYPGVAYWNVQRALLDLKRRGILLAIASKNNREEALQAIRVHSGMLLKPEDFAAERINWGDKPANLREIAAELNVGLDSLAFLDDNPAERERVRLEAPEVTVLELPADPMGFGDAIRSAPVLERLAVSEEDAQRSRYYSEQRSRAVALSSAGNLEDFYRSLMQEVSIEPVNAATLKRAAQLTQKTNQFNVTTRRYHEQQLAELAATPGWDIYTVRVKDRFGDNGVVGLMVLQSGKCVSEIDTFLLSCRVISRTVETAMLSFLVSESCSQGMSILRGWVFPTEKNVPSRDVYARHGFEICSSSDSGTLWSLDLTRARVSCPDWIRLTVSKGLSQREFVLS